MNKTKAANLGLACNLGGALELLCSYHTGECGSSVCGECGSQSDIMRLGEATFTPKRSRNTHAGLDTIKSLEINVPGLFTVPYRYPDGVKTVAFTTGKPARHAVGLWSRS